MCLSVKFQVKKCTEKYISELDMIVGKPHIRSIISDYLFYPFWYQKSIFKLEYGNVAGNFV